MSKLKQALKKVKNYVVNDLREIIAPTSLPNPPGYVPASKTPKREWLKITSQAFRTYVDTWNTEKLSAIYKEKHGADPFEAELTATKKELKSLAEEIGEASRGGATALKPFMQHLWNTRAVAYRDAVQQFILGYKEGFQESNKPDIPQDVNEEMQKHQAKEQPQQNSAGQHGEGKQDQHTAQEHLQNKT